MMDGTAQGLLIGEPEVNVAAMAAIVRDLVADGLDRIPGAAWLQARVDRTNLGPHERAALETLHRRLCERGSSLLDALGSSLGGW